MGYCGKCGTSICEGDFFCKSCGAKCDYHEDGVGHTANVHCRVKEFDEAQYTSRTTRINKKVVGLSVSTILLCSLFVFGVWFFFFKPMGVVEYELATQKCEAEIQSAYKNYNEKIYPILHSGGELSEEDKDNLKTALKNCLDSEEQSLAEMSSFRAPEKYKSEEIALKDYAEHTTNIDNKRLRGALKEISSFRMAFQYEKLFEDEEYNSVAHENMLSGYNNAGKKLNWTGYEDSDTSADEYDDESSSSMPSGYPGLSDVNDDYSY